jgi:hypothetical protein
MKTSRFTLVKTIVVVSLLIGLSNAALARTSVYLGIGVGRPGSHHSQRPGSHHSRRPRSHHSRRPRYRFSRRPRYSGLTWRHSYPRRKTIIISGGRWYDRGSDYYVFASPVIERPPVIVEKQIVIVQPVEFDESTLQLNKKLQYKKNELLKQLQAPDKEQRMEAIKELAGFSFDDKVRQALENILLSDPDAELRKEAARTFGKVKNTKALAALEKARVEDSSEDVRKEADESIKRIKGN